MRGPHEPCELESANVECAHCTAVFTITVEALGAGKAVQQGYVQWDYLFTEFVDISM